MLDTSRYQTLTDAGLSHERIEAAPVPIRSLFREFSHPLVFAALDAVGLDVDPATLTEEFVDKAATEARKLILAHISEDIEARLSGYQS
ncbi:hypothetical protein HOU02_gp454 [Caulobacter phage CcrBL9]|uniref:Uncharacterized protein n=1 Tax=Caulobacter phage CcrBL9 TaxID=2283270 RepID=A0A385EBK5_9CAUD|nr:hypothetical protein HOU02_gp454 [Caulobacter phage CcrBL9]AXQ69271.1 hypothetical protein CcrBL9_gp247c [Caulobacter phage CcrBL9]